MIKKFGGVCPKYGVNVMGVIDYLNSGTREGNEYSKNGVDCNHKVDYKCTRNSCPFWKNAQKIIVN